MKDIKSHAETKDAINKTNACHVFTLAKANCNKLYNNMLYWFIPKQKCICAQCVKIFFLEWEVSKYCCHLQQQ